MPLRNLASLEGDIEKFLGHSRCFAPRVSEGGEIHAVLLPHVTEGIERWSIFDVSRHRGEEKMGYRLAAGITKKMKP